MFAKIKRKLASTLARMIKAYRNGNVMWLKLGQTELDWRKSAGKGKS